MQYGLKYYILYIFTHVGAARPLNAVRPANVNKQRGAGLLFWRVCLSVVEASSECTKKGKLFLLFWFLVLKVLKDNLMNLPPQPLRMKFTSKLHAEGISKEVLLFKKGKNEHFSAICQLVQQAEQY